MHQVLWQTEQKTIVVSEREGRQAMGGGRGREKTSETKTEIGSR